MTTDRTNKIRRVACNERVELCNSDASISYGQLHDCSYTSCDADTVGARDTCILVNEATVSLDTVPKKEKSVQIQETTALPDWEKAAEIALVRTNHAFLKTIMKK